MPTKESFKAFHKRQEFTRERMERICRMYNSAVDAAAEIPGGIHAQSLRRVAKKYGLTFRQCHSLATEFAMKDTI